MMDAHYKAMNLSRLVDPDIKINKLICMKLNDEEVQ